MGFRYGDASTLNPKPFWICGASDSGQPKALGNFLFQKEMPGISGGSGGSQKFPKRLEGFRVWA